MFNKKKCETIMDKNGKMIFKHHKFRIEKNYLKCENCPLKVAVNQVEVGEIKTK